MCVCVCVYVLCECVCVYVCAYVCVYYFVYDTLCMNTKSEYKYGNPALQYITYLHIITS